MTNEGNSLVPHLVAAETTADPSACLPAPTLSLLMG